MRLLQPTIAALLVLSSSMLASASILESDVNTAGALGSTGSGDAQFTYDASIKTNDLINQGSASFLSQTSTGTTSTGGAGGGTVDKLNDGGASGKTTSAGANDLSKNTFYAGSDLAGNPTVTFNLNTTLSPAGYNITQINSINGWQDTHTFSDQKYAVYVATVSNPSFALLKSVDYIPFSSDVAGNDAPHSSQVTLTDSTGVLASGVTALRFNFLLAGSGDGALTANQSGQVIREIDVLGVAVPEPAGGLLLAAALPIWLLFRRRHFGSAS